jgi:hypothetical protein
VTAHDPRYPSRRPPSGVRPVAVEDSQFASERTSAMFWGTGWLKSKVGTIRNYRGTKKPAAKVKRRTLLQVEQLESREVPALVGQDLYPADNAWNQQITNAPLAANSAAIIAAIAADMGSNTRISNDFFNHTPGSSEVLYGIPINVVHGNSVTKVNVVIENYPDESDLDPSKPVAQGLGYPAPIPTNVLVEGDFQNGPRTMAQGNDGDRHLIVWDQDTNIAYEYYQYYRPGEVNPWGTQGDGKAHAAQITVWDMDTNTYFNPSRQVGWTSVDAAGLSVLAGLVRPDEGLPTSMGGQGLIDHALRFTLQNDIVRDKYLYPASHHANPNNPENTNELPMGGRLRLKASVDISTLNPESRVIAQAMKDYGLILADNGSNMYINGASSVYYPDTAQFFTWSGSLFEEAITSTTNGLRRLRVTDFEVVNLTPVVTGLSTTTGPAGTTLTVIGQNFSGAAGNLSVLFGNTAGTNVTYIDDAHISVTVPTGTGTVDVRVRSGQVSVPGDSVMYNVNTPVFGYGLSANTAADNFTYGGAGNTAPTVATAASASPGTVTGLTTILSVLGADNGGEAALTYTWAATTTPSGATPTFSANGTNAAKSSTVTFNRAGSYTFQATIRDAGGLTVTSSVNVTVNQTLTSISVTPGSSNLPLNGTQQFTATAKDQFGINLATQPTFTWSLLSGPGGVNASGLYTANSTAGTATVRAVSGAVNGTATAVVANTAPGIQTAPSATPNPVTGSTASLSVLGRDDNGEAGLTYTWSVFAKPAGAANPTFSANGTNAAKSSTATFSQAGAYTLRVTISDGTLSTTSDLGITVNQTPTSIAVSPSSASIATNGTQQFTATVRDQFGIALASQPAITWSIVSGGGTVGTGGLYTAPATAGSATVRATSGAINGTAGVTITATNAAPTVATAASATPNPVIGATTSLSVLGADDAGEAGLTYTWAVTAKPTGAADPTFSVNGTNASKSSTATFSQAGAYTFQVTIRDSANSAATSSVNVTVNQTLTTIVVAPGNANVPLGGTQQFTANARDQFGNSLTTQPTFTWSVISGLGTINSGGFYSATATAGAATVRAASGAVNGTATVTAANVAPVLDPSGSPTLAAIDEDAAASASVTIASLLGSSVTDADAGALKGIAVIGVGGGGNWQYSTNGGTSFVNFGSPSSSAARLLRDTDSIRFVPAANFNGNSTITFRAWDRTSGAVGGTADITATGGSTAFSAAQEFVSITINPVNDAPVLATGTSALTPVAVNQLNAPGNTVAGIVATSISDVDAGALQGIAVVAASTSGGHWEYSTTGGASFFSFGTVSAAAARLLDADDLIRFVPNPDFTLTTAASVKPTITYRAWDQTAGSDGAVVSVTALGTGTTKPFSTVTRTANVVVNSAPTLNTSGNPVLPTTDEDKTSASVTISSLVGTAIADVGTGALKGIAVIGMGGGGTWQYSTNGGASFVNFGNPSSSAARLLRDTDRVRFVPTANFNGTSALTFRAWDRTSGNVGGTADITATGGGTAFSAGQEIASITINAVNDAPVLAAGVSALTPVAVNSTNPAGDTVASFTSSFISDVDAGALQGIAVVAASTSGGHWEYSTNGGASFLSFGTVSAGAARLLDLDDRVRFVPNPDFTLTTAASVKPTITYRAWDQTTGSDGAVVSVTALGTGTTKPFSVATRTASVVVNSAPVLTPATTVLGPTASTTTITTTVAALLGSTVTDAGTGAVEGIAVTGLTVAGGGKWQYSTNGGTTYVDFGAPAEGTARLLRATDRLRYVPAGAVGQATITFRAWDQTTGTAGTLANLTLPNALGQQTAFSLATGTATLNIV